MPTDDRLLPVHAVMAGGDAAVGEAPDHELRSDARASSSDASPQAEP